MGRGSRTTGLGKNTKPNGFNSDAVSISAELKEAERKADTYLNEIVFKDYDEDRYRILDGLDNQVQKLKRQLADCKNFNKEAKAIAFVPVKNPEGIPGILSVETKNGWQAPEYSIPAGSSAAEVLVQNLQDDFGIELETSDVLGVVSTEEEATEVVCEIDFQNIAPASNTQGWFYDDDYKPELANSPTEALNYAQRLHFNYQAEEALSDI